MERLFSLRMSSAIAPYEPLDVPKPVAGDIWIVDGPEIRFGYLGLKLPFTTRMTIVRLPDGTLFVHSPTEPTPELFAAVEALGPVRHLIAPNTIHYWWVPEWKARFPHARVYAVSNLESWAKRDIAPDERLGPVPPAAWAGAIDQLIVSGDVLVEAIFFHRASSSLILTDLIENFEPSRVRSPFYRLLLRLSGAADPDGKAPIDMQYTFRRQKKAFAAALNTMIGWAPERVILAHGRWYPANGIAELRRAFRWALA
ncbi:MAG TPA: DUF4336 domain-containing protein [Rhizomicrobium sp.]|nr:DUF4336 domain-containing protein [Rhizomicrobium sp.]